MTLQADSAGVITGQFTIPANIPVGSKLVQFIGNSGSYGQATYTARGVITNEERRRVTTLTEVSQEQTWILVQNYDPLAQTFTLNQSRHIGGVDLWFTEKGTQKVVVQIRETSTGLPNQNILAETHLQSNELNVDGTHTRICWTPVYLEAGREYAIVILTDDADTAINIAELGKYDQLNQQWVTSQPYQVGVLLSSSNASTWTPHQEKDMCFRLLGAHFTSTSQTVDLGTINVSEVSDVITLANIERPAVDTDIEFILKDDVGHETSLSDDQPLALHERLDGDVNIKAVLKGSTISSPVMFPGLQVVLGNVQETADYVTRAIPAGTNSKVTVTYESLLPGQANVTVELEDSNGNWQPLTLDHGKQIGDGWEERVHSLIGFNGNETRIRLNLSGDVLYRPRVRALRVIIT